jgi:molybdopterin/thiamine biosynthesis adenylyltransferase
MNRASILKGIPFIYGVIASIQSLEAITLILGIGELLTNILLIFNGMDMTFRKIETEKNADCPVCGGNADSGLITQPS